MFLIRNRKKVILKTGKWKIPSLFTNSRAGKKKKNNNNKDDNNTNKTANILMDKLPET